MSQVKVKYTGMKQKIAINLPFGAKSRGEIKEVIFFSKNETKSLPEKDALALCEYDSNFEPEFGFNAKKPGGRPKKLSSIDSEPKSVVGLDTTINVFEG